MPSNINHHCFFNPSISQSINHLPKDILLHICTFLDYADLIRFQQTNKYHCEIIDCNNRSLWKRLYSRHFGPSNYPNIHPETLFRLDFREALRDARFGRTSLNESIYKLFKHNRDFTLSVVKGKGNALKYFSERLRDDKEIVLAAVNENGFALEWASHSLKNDRDVVLAAVKKNGRALVLASHSLKNDRNIVLAAVKNNANALEWASHIIKNDRDVVLAAVKRDGTALRWASNNLKDDNEVFLTAFDNNSDVIRYASLRIASYPSVRAFDLYTQQNSYTLRFKGSTDHKNTTSWLEPLEMLIAHCYLLDIVYSRRYRSRVEKKELAANIVFNDLNHDIDVEYRWSLLFLIIDILFNEEDNDYKFIASI